MSFSTYAAHLYGVMIENEPLRDEFDEIETDFGDGDLYGIMDLATQGLYEELLPGFPESAKDIEVFGGPGAVNYIGYGAVMPYEFPRKTKEEMDESIHELMVYLFGEKIGRQYHPEIIYDAWAE